MKTGGSFDIVPLKALVVDDNVHARVLVKTLLHAAGLRTLRECPDGASALAILESFTPDFIVTDHSMAPMDGVAFTRAVRAMHDNPLQMVPIILATGHTERAVIEAARDAGVSEILAKPITAGGLVGRIEQVILRPRPFVRSATYCGPSRRRLRNPNYKGPFRRAEDRNDLTIVDDLNKVND